MRKASQTFAQGVSSDSTVSWEGVNSNREDNYWITDDSKPAKLGSSLGWLQQLDGDNMRNAFLNAPWVKAVLPIRPGKEKQAINWMTHASVEGTDGLDSKYQFSEEAEKQAIINTLKTHKWTDQDDIARYGDSFDSVTVMDAIKYLAIVVANKNDMANEKQDITIGNDVVQSLPTDIVFEHGYYPLQGGFKAKSDKPFEVFDQWIEVLPTDQVAAVEVQYDPKTGRQM
jgi:hypothetical protein